MSKTETKLRIPRPFGITSLMVEFNKQSPEIRDEFLGRVRSTLINHWLISNGELCGYHFSSEGLSRFLGCDPSIIQDYLRDKLLNTKIWDRSIQEQMINGLVSQQIVWSMEDRMDIQSQVELLKASQGDTYKAFISSEYNKVLKLKLDSTSSLQSMVKGLVGNNTVNIFAPQADPLANVNNGVTTEHALVLIAQQLAELGPADKDADVRYIENKYRLVDNPDEYPEVIASKQVGKGEKEGLNILKRDQLSIIDNYKLHRTEDAERDHHDMRREIEDNIEEDGEDPELDYYNTI